MQSTLDSQTLRQQLNQATVKLGDIKKQAKAIKQDHQLGLNLWATAQLNSRLLAVLIFDKKRLEIHLIEQLAADILSHSEEQACQLADWLMANQLMKSKATIELLQTWQNHNNAFLRRLYWYHQARLRWMGQTPPNNSAELLSILERDMANEVPVVQWAMNFCAAQIGIYQSELRQRCIALGETTKLYKNQKVPKNCTPNYLPEFIRIEVEKKT
ncbi:DNA alkylation repair protein [Paraglaciecola aestuariivivens]